MKTRQEYISELLAIAKSDLHDALCLYANSSYRNALYLLQQSVEKTMKVWALLVYTKVEQEKLVFKIGHTSPRAFFLLMEEGLPKLTDIISNIAKEIGFSEIESSIDEELQNIVDNNYAEGQYFKGIFQKDEREKRSFYKTMAKGLLDSFSETGVIQQLLDTAEISKEYGNLTCSFINMIASLFLSKLPNNIREQLDFYLFEITEYVRDFSDKFSPLLLLALITFPYESCTRYPNDKLCYDQFNLELEIIKSFPRMAKMLIDGLEWFEIYINKYFFSDHVVKYIKGEIKEKFKQIKSNDGSV
ncbi:MAG: hypothetical protein ACTSQE_13635 [Candidatus Heimdallarchaeaceae archaeon]